MHDQNFHKRQICILFMRELKEYYIPFCSHIYTKKMHNHAENQKRRLIKTINNKTSHHFHELNLKIAKETPFCFFFQTSINYKIEAACIHKIKPQNISQTTRN